MNKTERDDLIRLARLRAKLAQDPGRRAGEDPHR
jgi:hypothetical protein